MWLSAVSKLDLAQFIHYKNSHILLFYFSMHILSYTYTLSHDQWTSNSSCIVCDEALSRFYILSLHTVTK